MKNVTTAADKANKIFAATNFLNKWAAKRDEEFVAKHTAKIEEIKKDKEGLFIVCGKTYQHKEAIKKAGFTFCAGSWYSEKSKDLDIDGLMVIEG